MGAGPSLCTPAHHTFGSVLSQIPPRRRSRRREEVETFCFRTRAAKKKTLVAPPPPPPVSSCVNDLSSLPSRCVCIETLAPFCGVLSLRGTCLPVLVLRACSCGQGYAFAHLSGSHTSVCVCGEKQIGCVSPLSWPVPGILVFILGPKCLQANLLPWQVSFTDFLLESTLKN